MTRPAGRQSRPRWALAVLGTCVGVFLAGAPYTLLDLPGFLNGFANLSAFYAPRPRVGDPGWLIYLKHLRIVLHWPALILTFAGLILALARSTTGPGHLRWVMLAVFPLVYFSFIARQHQIYGRYLLPVLPFTCILAAGAVISGVTLLRRFDIPRGRADRADCAAHRAPPCSRSRENRSGSIGGSARSPPRRSRTIGFSSTSRRARRSRWRLG